MALSNVSWKGLKAFEVMSTVLPDKIAGQRLRAAYRYALTPTRDQMRNNLPDNKTGALWHATDISLTGQNTIGFLSGIVGPRRKRGVWNMQGWHAHIIELGTKPHTIKSKKGYMMPVFTKGGLVGYRKQFEHPGTKGKSPFSRAIDSTWMKVNDRIVDKVSGIMRDEIKNIWTQYGQQVSGINVEGFK